MSDKGQSPDGAVRFGAVTRPKSSEELCGDGYLFLPNDNGVLYVLVDGLGHGLEAYRTAQETLRYFRKHVHLHLDEAVWNAHRELRHTRGCAVFLGRIDIPNRQMECVSIGNITCKLRTHDGSYPVAVPGVLGHNLRKVNSTSIPLRSGDWLVLCSDGVSTRFDLEEFESFQPDIIAEEILQRYGYPSDDASVLVIRLEFGDD